jgi:hypothetical protein
MIGFSVEVGRPGVGARLRDLDKVTRKVVSLGGQFADYNPVLALMDDRAVGSLQAEVLNEKVLSAIAEFMVPRDKAIGMLIELIPFLNKELDSVATVSLIARHDDNGRLAFRDELAECGRELGFTPYPNGKVNIGLALVR